MTRTAFAIVLFSMCCSLASGDSTSGQPSAAVPAWHIGKTLIQADDEWLNPAPLEFDRHIRGSGSVLQKRLADDIVFADSPDSEQRRVGIGLEPALSPDGRSVAYCGVAKKSNDPGWQPGWQIVKATADATRPVELTHLKNNACDPAWSPDGSKIAFNTEGSKGAVVGVLDLASSNILAISPGARPQWSPDGKRLVFLRWPEVAGGPNSIWIVNADGSGLKKVTDTRALLPSANWGADGASIIFTNEDHNRSRIFRVNLDGSHLEELAGDNNFDMYFPSVSPDGKRLIVIADSDKAPTLMLIDLETHKSRVLRKALRASVQWVKDR